MPSALPPKKKPCCLFTLTICRTSLPVSGSQPTQLLAGGQLPDADGAVLRCRDHLVAVGQIGDEEDGVTVPPTDGSHAGHGARGKRIAVDIGARQRRGRSLSWCGSRGLQR